MVVLLIRLDYFTFHYFSCLTSLVRNPRTRLKKRGEIRSISEFLSYRKGLFLPWNFRSESPHSLHFLSYTFFYFKANFIFRSIDTVLPSYPLPSLWPNTWEEVTYGEKSYSFWLTVKKQGHEVAGDITSSVMKQREMEAGFFVYPFYLVCHHHEMLVPTQGESSLLSEFSLERPSQA